MKIVKPLINSAILFLIVSCVYADDTKAPTLNFKWPTSGCVPVEEHVSKNGNIAELHYKICSHPNKNDSKLLTITYQDMSVVSMNGEPLAPQTKVLLTKSFSNLPGFYVNKADGQFAGLEPKSLERTFEIFAELSNDNHKQELETVKSAMLNSPEILEMVEASVANPWGAMVSFWHGVDEYGDFMLEDDQLYFSYEPASKDRYSLSLYSFSPENFEVFKKFMNSVTQDPKAADNIDINNLGVESQVEVITDRNLRPYDVRMSKTVTFISEGKEHTMEEIRESTFDWDNFKKS